MAIEQLPGKCNEVLRGKQGFRDSLIKQFNDVTKILDCFSLCLL